MVPLTCNSGGSGDWTVTLHMIATLLESHAKYYDLRSGPVNI